ncbi:MAG: DUF2695 domain-containing protein [Sphingomonadales bacterium]|nr:DUF2695 domain-containing protein [Sphingomonadales bacterium]
MAATSLPIPLSQAQALVGYVFHQLGVPDDARCDHTYRHARAYCDSIGADWPAVEIWLKANGGACDCEVLFNTGRRFEGEA